MKTWTRVIAWFWLLYYLYAGTSRLVGSEPAVDLGLKLAFTAGWHDPEFAIGFDFAALAIVIAAVSLLGQKAWGWWALMINAGLTMVLALIAAVAPTTSGVQISATPLAIFVMFVVAAVPVVATIFVLSSDPPWKWSAQDASPELTATD